MAVVLRCDPALLEGVAARLSAVSEVMQEARSRFAINSGAAAPESAFGAAAPAAAWRDLCDALDRGCRAVEQALAESVQCVNVTLDAFQQLDDDLSASLGGFLSDGGD